MNDQHITVLAIDDDPGDVELLNRQLSDIPGISITFTRAQNATAGFEALENPDIDVIFLDYLLGDRNGMDVLEQIRASGELRGVIMLTGQTSASLAVSLTHAGADDYVDKHAITPDLLRRAIDNALAQQRQREAYQQNKLLLDDLKNANRMLEKKNEKLADLYCTAHQFVDNVSHEFRTPLAVIKEYASLIHDGVLGEVNSDQIEFLDVIGNRVEDLTLMVDDMLDISRFGAGMMRVSRRTCHVSDIITHIQPNLDRRALVNKVQLEINIPSGLPQIYCDPEKIGRTIINLTVNALKFAPEGGNVLVWAKNGPAGDQLTIGVTDNGPGISEENRELIFRRFKQIDGDIRQSTKGFGLGLNIAKELVHVNFGQINIDSKVGKGSTFSFTLPISEPITLIGRYLQWLIQTNQPTAVSLVWAKAASVVDQNTAKEMGDFLRKHAKPRDLLFAPVSGIWLLVAQCEQPEVKNMTARLKKEYLEANRNRPGCELPEIRFETIGTWIVPKQQKQFKQRFNKAIAIDQIAYG